MIKRPIDLQELRRRLHAKAKEAPKWRFWGLYVHVCKSETLATAYAIAKRNDGAPGIDGVTFDQIEQNGAGAFLESLRNELIQGTYRPMPNRLKEIPKGNGKTRTLGIPTIKDRVVQGALKLILEPIFEADFHEGSFGYRPNKSAREAINTAAVAVVRGKTRVIDLDLSAYFDSIKHSLLLQKVAKRVEDGKVLRLIKLMLKAGGRSGVPQGGVISPLLANLFLNDVDAMLERAKEHSREGKYTRVEYARYADDLVVLIDGHPNWEKLYRQVRTRLKQELDQIEVKINPDKSKELRLEKGDAFDFLGFTFRRCRTARGKLGVRYRPKISARTKFLETLRKLLRAKRTDPIAEVVAAVNRRLRGWVNYFRIGHSGRCFRYVRNWIINRLRRHLSRQSKNHGIGYKRYPESLFYEKLNLFDDYQVRYFQNCA